METTSIISKLSCNTSSDGGINSENRNTNVLAKIKRLQIEEKHIRHSLNKSISDNANIFNFTEDFKDSDYHKFKTNITDSYNNVKKLFKYVQENTSNQEKIKIVDVDDIKMAIVELEERIKTLKKYLQLELSNLKKEEEELEKNVNDNPARTFKIRKRPNTLSYKEIVPSPVKEIINSSFRCLEVQEFQDFMASSKNRHGGWNEYYHNIFVRSWNKYVQVNFDLDLKNYIANVMNSEAFQAFINDLLPKLPGFQIEDIISHSQWYSKYVYLKERQKLAIEKWRQNKLLITKPTRKENDTRKSIKNGHRGNSESDSTYKMNCDIKEFLDQSTLKSGFYKEGCINKIKVEMSENSMDATCDRRRLRGQYLKPTKQWISRCQNENEKPRNSCLDPEQISKLQIPKWRLSLRNT